MGFILTLLFLASIVLNCVLLASNRYSKLLIGTVVGKFKGDKYKGGYVVVETDVEYLIGESSMPQYRKEQKTYEVPDEYYTSKNIGDKGLFPW